MHNYPRMGHGAKCVCGTRNSCTQAVLLDVSQIPLIQEPQGAKLHPMVWVRAGIKVNSLPVNELCPDAT